ncbi:hypothetical protein B7463_g3355, partial [Scytalidium lignicola]
MKPASPPSLLLFLQFTSAAPIAPYYRKGASEGCINGSPQQLSPKGFRCQIPVLKHSGPQHLSHVPLSSPPALEEEGDDEEAIWFDDKPIPSLQTMPAEEPRDVQPPRTISTMRRPDGLVWEEDGVVFEQGGRVWDQDNANLLVVLLVFAFLCIMLGTEAIKRINGR